MNESIDRLLTELEELSAKALQQADRGELIPAAETIAQRGEAVRRLQTALASAGPLSYTEWNRLTVIHFQGNRVEASLQTTRACLSGELVESARDGALLRCVTGVVGGSAPGHLNERG